MALIASGRLPVLDLVTHRVPFIQAPGVYTMLDQREQEAGAVLLLWGEEKER